RCDELERGMSEPVTALGQSNRESVAEDAREFVGFAMRAMTGEHRDAIEPHRLRPELLRSLIAIGQFHPAAMEDVAPWVDRLCGLGALGSLGPATPAARDGWAKLRAGWELVRQSQAAAIPWN